MSIWILIVALHAPNGAAMTTAEYSSKDACMAAGMNFDAASRNDGWRVAWSCNQK